MAIGRSKVVIAGAGNVGTALAHQLVIRNTCNDLVLIDRNREKAWAEVTDLRHSMGYYDSKMHVCTGAYPDCADADIVVVKVWVLNSQEESCLLNPDFISLLCKRFPTHKVSSANNMVYIRNSVYASDQEGNLSGHELTDRLDAVLDKAATAIAPGERICYAVSCNENDMDVFINNLHFNIDIGSIIYFSFNI